MADHFGVPAAQKCGQAEEFSPFRYKIGSKCDQRACLNTLYRAKRVYTTPPIFHGSASFSGFFPKVKNRCFFTFFVTFLFQFSLIYVYISN